MTILIERIVLNFILAIIVVAVLTGINIIPVLFQDPFNVVPNAYQEILKAGNLLTLLILTFLFNQGNVAWKLLNKMGIKI